MGNLHHPSIIRDGSHIRTAADLHIDDGCRYRIGNCVLTTVCLEDIGLVGCELLTTLMQANL